MNFYKLNLLNVYNKVQVDHYEPVGNQIIELWPNKFKTSYFNRMMITGLRLFITFCFGGKHTYLCTFVLKLRAKI